jgi:MscS family membrane protein
MIRSATIVLVSILAAWLVEVLVRRVVMRVAERTASTLDDLLVKEMRRPVYLSVMLLGLSWAVAESEISRSVRESIDGVLATVAILLWTLAVNRVCSTLLQQLSDRAKSGALVQPRTKSVFDLILKIATWALAVYLVFLAWEIDLTAWLASAGVLGVAVGFAAKDTLANFFSGIFILADAPYTIGDFIKLEDGIRGRVTAIGMRSTRVLTRDEVEITIPNAVIGNAQIINESGGPSRKQRLHVPFTVAYGSDIGQVRAVVGGCMSDVPHVSADPEPRVLFRGFGDSSLELELLVWLTTPLHLETVVDQANERIYAALNEAGIEIPYNKVDLYVKETP